MYHTCYNCQNYILWLCMELCATGLSPATIWSIRSWSCCNLTVQEQLHRAIILKTSHCNVSFTTHTRLLLISTIHLHMFLKYVDWLWISQTSKFISWRSQDIVRNWKENPESSQRGRISKETYFFETYTRLFEGNRLWNVSSSSHF